ncbi:YkgJ family cysteine cluster protein, partial [Candidatus Micrarchaeota archaeon]|nr:YkgJ family cysteine cluster protein [Candidatus Micrarchaeota archaeon]
MKSIKSICYECQKCCKKYDITLLPAEVKRISKKLNLSEKKFIEKYCDLTLQFFPSFNSKNLFVIQKAKLPKKI